MKHILFSFGVVLLLTDCKTASLKEKSDVPVGCWMHSREEDTNQNEVFKTYRTCKFSFPASRGRNGFLIKADGTIGLIGPSPVDGVDTTWGTWVQIEKNQLKLSFNTTKISRLSWQKSSSKILLVDLH